MVYYSQFQIALPRALANFVGKLETTYRTSKFGSPISERTYELQTEVRNFARPKVPGHKIHKLNNRNYKQIVLYK